MKKLLHIAMISLLTGGLSACFTAAVAGAGAAGGYVVGKEVQKEEPEDKIIKKSE